MNKELYKNLAEQLYKAQKERQAIAPLSDNYDIDVVDAYRIQLTNIDHFVDEGRVISGKKIGLTSLAMQNMFQVNEPDYGHLFSDVYFEENVDSSLFIQPKVEGEVAFVLKEDLIGPNVTVEEVLEKTDYVQAALEIVDSRIADWNIKLVDTVADNASFGGYCLGKIRLEPSACNLKELQMEFYKNNELVNKGSGVDVLGDPAFCVAWLANKMGEFNIPLKKGEVVLSGAFSAALPAVKGDVFEAKFTTLGSVVCRFE
ncbi:2-keto-4-pentenoate hydratase [Breznakia sp. PF5-3]|uniref:2-keto-4-pentenoate hydratase n=1 Tax=unclassified Breznakia TaxID=2623764 RepID=UPI0024057637|nr:MULTISPECIES: 2-keto-4-pentenoate hydratase [unclassified Breznakia]MDL2276216.1 2-keto-4-pentenoate hydratase [Breznakia sp. OttesenSCG-928-G09]MDF9825038.1 2-keto-4-pentenoate hydratase [Breznakia sp. PM6-1]MDF9835885.1 2-keto-4-pentenoate hydratase [Breznakia sp. PF5-3]MDF9837346.1 2-keto-4-pentenoate hydratase [Breznakia sp. PFB2-8]MDF9859281.1 2-keto-4-pentenoate hydratase [Breznakia sp. PH5-24]